MAQYSEANTKTQVANAATALTLIFKDTVLTEVAAPLSSPTHPLRKIEKLFNFNASTGVVSSDDAYITACFAGTVPYKQNPFQVFTEVDLRLSSAVVANATPTVITLTFTEPIGEYSGVDVGGAPKIVESVVIAGAVVTITVAEAYAFGDTITVEGTFISHSNGKVLTLADEAVTNNVEE